MRAKNAKGHWVYKCDTISDGVGCRAEYDTRSDFVAPGIDALKAIGWKITWMPEPQGFFHRCKWCALKFEKKKRGAPRQLDIFAA
jgi:hypothetical protein